MYDLFLIVPLLAIGATDGSWNFGEGLTEDDKFLYYICDERFSDSYTGDYGRCYTVSLDVKNKIDIKDNTFYLIHAITEDYIDTTDRLFLVDSKLYKVKNIFQEDIDYANSLQNTLFWQNGWGQTIKTSHGSASVQLEHGNAESSLILSDSTIAQNGAAQYSVTHDSFESSHLTINDALPLPISSKIFTYGATEQTTRPLFSFELQSHTTPATRPVQTPYPEIHNSFFEVDWR